MCRLCQLVCPLQLYACVLGRVIGWIFRTLGLGSSKSACLLFAGRGTYMVKDEKNYLLFDVPPDGFRGAVVWCDWWPRRAVGPTRDAGIGLQSIAFNRCSALLSVAEISAPGGSLSNSSVDSARVSGAWPRKRNPCSSAFVECRSEHLAIFGWLRRQYNLCRPQLGLVIVSFGSFAQTSCIPAASVLNGGLTPLVSLIDCWTAFARKARGVVRLKQLLDASREFHGHRKSLRARNWPWIRPFHWLVGCEACNRLGLIRWLESSADDKTPLRQGDSTAYARRRGCCPALRAVIGELDVRTNARLRGLDSDTMIFKLSLSVLCRPWGRCMVRKNALAGRLSV